MNPPVYLLPEGEVLFGAPVWIWLLLSPIAANPTLSPQLADRFRFEADRRCGDRATMKLWITGMLTSLDGQVEAVTQAAVVAATKG